MRCFGRRVTHRELLGSLREVGGRDLLLLSAFPLLLPSCTERPRNGSGVLTLSVAIMLGSGGDDDWGAGE